MIVAIPIARNDVEIQEFTLAARFRPSFASRCPSSLKRTQGKPGADCARSPVCESPVEKSTRVKLQVQPGHPGFPRAMVYGLYVLSPVSGVSCHRHRRDIIRRLDATVAAPGPHVSIFELG